MANCEQCGRKLPPLTLGRKICEWCVRHEAAQREGAADDAVQPIMPVPWARQRTASMGFTQLIVGINVAVFAGMALAGVSLSQPTGQQLIHWGANWGPLTLGDGEWWRLLTSIFLHIGFLHIAFNMWCLWNLGQLAESLYGPGTFTGFYLISGLAASVSSVAWHPVSICAGASGAIFGLAGALIASFYLGEFSLPRAAIQGTLKSVVLFAVYNLIFGALPGSTDNAAHIGGLVTGLLLGAMMAKLAPVRENPVVRSSVLIVFLLLIVVWVAWLQHVRHYALS
jgi:rhomboid protease GluP